jgi:hypothetical protein
MPHRRGSVGGCGTQPGQLSHAGGLQAWSVVAYRSLGQGRGVSKARQGDREAQQGSATGKSTCLAVINREVNFPGSSGDTQQGSQLPWQQ